MRQRRMLTDLLVYLAVRLAAMVFQMFPVNWNLATARRMVHIWCRIMPRHLNRAREHLRLAYNSQLSPRQIDQLAFRSLEQMSMMAMECLFTPRLINELTWHRYIRLNGIDKALDRLLRGQGAILVTGHYGSWELVGFALAALGFPLTAVMRPLDNPWLNEFILGIRARRGLQLLYKKGASQSAGDVLESGGLLGFIADQNAGRKGEFVDFFGQKASTYKSIGLLAVQHNVPILVGYARRLSDNFEYEVGCNRIIEPHEWADKPDQLHWITQEYTSAIEQFIRQAPEQYLWIHRRWKTRPKDEQS
ncbi:MAG: lysophospholipid acyltransferase family protein [Phycisphaerae bacterium]|nr:lysophospholipid acyltransferase family protein [Phycisphaerae bacterium]